MKYGTIFSMDYEPSLRLMAVGPISEGKYGYSPERTRWNAIVVFDPAWKGPPTSGMDIGWQTGLTIDFNLNDTGINVIEESL